MSTALILLLILLFMLGGAFFGASETILVSASRARLHQRATQDDKKAARTLAFIERMERVLGTTVVGANVTVVTATTLASMLVVELLAGYNIADKWSSLVNMIIMTPLILIVCELTPKAIGRLHADRFITVFSPILRFFQFLFFPLVLITDWFGMFCARLAGGSPGASPGAVTREDLLAMAVAAAEHGVVEEDAGAMISTVFELEKRPVASVMVPLVDIRAVSENATVLQVAETAVESGYTRFPVYRRRVDEIVGIVDLRQVMYGIGEQWREGSGQVMDMPVKSFIYRNFMLAPETKSVSSLLHELRFQKIPMAVVIDEHGGVTGVVTVEDLVEELVGEIRDERDKESRKLRQVEDNVYECDGKVELREINSELGIEVADQDFETVAGLVLKLAGRIPQKEASFQYQGYEIKVLEVVNRRVAKLRFQKLPVQEPPVE